MQETENDILRRVRKIEIKTRGLSNEIFAGKYHTAFRGRGMSFSEVREYRAGDDVRDIDWNVTARSNKPHIKVYEEERELTMMLLVDVSGSRMFGTTDRLKKNIITEIAAVLAFPPRRITTRWGASFFRPYREVHSAEKGRKHILFIIRELLDFTPDNKGTDIAMVLRYFTDALKKRCTTFLISDFIDDKDYYKALSIASNKHDVYGVQVYDKRDSQIPDVGLMRVRDLETGAEQWIDTSSKKVRNEYQRWWYERQQRMSDTLNVAGSVCISSN